jgi:hypothetical protein
MTSLVVAAVLAGTPVKVAVPQFSASNVDAALTSVLADRFVSVLEQQGLRVTSAQDITVVLGLERQRHLLGCDDGPSCAVEMANALGVDAIILVSVARTEAGRILNVRVLRASTGERLVSGTERVKDEQGAQDWLDAQAREIPRSLRKALGLSVDELVTVPATPSPATPAPVVRWVPAMVGGGLAVLGSISLGYGFWAADQFNSGMLSEKGRADARQFGEATAAAGWISIGVGPALVAASVVWSLLAR